MIKTNDMDNMQQSIDTIGLFNTVVESAKVNGLYGGREFVKSEVESIANHLCIREDDAYLLALLMSTNRPLEFQREFKCSNLDLLYFADSLKRLAYDNFIVIKPNKLDWSINVDNLNHILHDLKPVIDYDTMSVNEMADMFEEAIRHRELLEDPKTIADTFAYRLNRLVHSSNPHVKGFLAAMDITHNGFNGKENGLVAFWMALLNNAAKHGNLFTDSLLTNLMKKLGFSGAEVPGYNLLVLMAEIVEDSEDGPDDMERFFRLTGNYAKQVNLKLSKPISPEQFLDKAENGKANRRFPFPFESAPREDVPTVGYQTLQADDIKEMQLFYNASEDRQIKRLRNLLMPEKLEQVQEQLSQMGHQGLVFLFYGAPGTGKTETCQQLAKASGRSLFCVDISQIKSKWIGESEKNLRATFDAYNEAVCLAKKEGRPFPILLLNEADSVVGKRVEVLQSVDQAHNALQNILLQEFEKTEGVIICTTNLTNNMDDAFERRFLYKVEFFRPDAATRQQIWKVKLPTLSEEDVASIAGEFEFSGGEIENVARKANVEAILNCQPLDIDLLREFAAEERLKKSNRPNRIGFSA